MTADIPNLLPIDLGGQLFDDNSVGGQNNGIKDALEGGLLGGTVNLYQMHARATLLITPLILPLRRLPRRRAVLYTNLDPGHYAVVIPASQLSGGVLDGYSNSTGNDPPSIQMIMLMVWMMV